MPSKDAKNKYYKDGEYIRRPCLRCGKPKGNVPPRSQLCEDCKEKQCTKKQKTEENSKKLKELKNRVSNAPEGQQWCNFCMSYKDRKCFYVSNSRNHYECKECHSKRFRKHNLLSVFGLTEEEYESLLEKQNGLCAICLKPPTGKKLAVDHNHKTGEIRGLLCWTCNNRVLGAARDNPDVLRRAADYLEKNIFFSVFGESRIVPGFGKRKRRKKRKPR